MLNCKNYKTSYAFAWKLCSYIIDEIFSSLEAEQAHKNSLVSQNPDHPEESWFTEFGYRKDSF